MLTAWKTDKGGNELENTSKWEVEYLTALHTYKKWQVPKTDNIT